MNAITLITKLAILPTLLFFSGCSAFTPVMDDVEKMVDNDAITIKVDKDSFQKDTDVHVEVDVRNKDIPAPKIIQE